MEHPVSCTPDCEKWNSQVIVLALASSSMGFVELGNLSVGFRGYCQV